MRNTIAPALVRDLISAYRGMEEVRKAAGDPAHTGIRVCITHLEHLLVHLEK